MNYFVQTSPEQRSVGGGGEHVCRMLCAFLYRRSSHSHVVVVARMSTLITHPNEPLFFSIIYRSINLFLLLLFFFQLAVLLCDL